MKKNDPFAANAPKYRTPHIDQAVSRSPRASGNNRSEHASEESNDAASLTSEVERLLSFARTTSHYQLLNLPPDAPRLEVKRRFYQLARQFHPDRHMDHPDLTSRLQTLMDSLTVAYRTLSDEVAKKGYDSRPEARKIKQEYRGPQIWPQDCVKNAESCVGVKNYVGSIVWLRRAIDIEPRSSEYRTMLGRSLAAIPEYRCEAVEQFERAIRLDSFNIAAHFQYAQLLEQLKFPLRARPHYARVLELDPRHLEARKRLNELDVKSPRSISRASLLTRLTGRG